MSSLDMIKPLKGLKTSQTEEIEIGSRDAWNQNKPSTLCRKYIEKKIKYHKSLEKKFEISS